VGLRIAFRDEKDVNAMNHTRGAEVALLQRLDRTARIGSAIAGAWLFVSALVWGRPAERMVSDALVGAAALTIALAALYVRPQLRILNVALAIWLFASLFVLPLPSIATRVSDLIVTSLLFAFSVIPARRAASPRLAGS
jgi:hypothetical protein